MRARRCRRVRWRWRPSRASCRRWRGAVRRARRQRRLVPARGLLVGWRSQFRQEVECEGWCRQRRDNGGASLRLCCRDGAESGVVSQVRETAVKALWLAGVRMGMVARLQTSRKSWEAVGKARAVRACGLTARRSLSSARVDRSCGAVPKMRACARVMSEPHCCAISVAAATQAW